jgi:hypothetical protein
VNNPRHQRQEDPHVDREQVSDRRGMEQLAAMGALGMEEAIGQSDAILAEDRS